MFKITIRQYQCFFCCCLFPPGCQGNKEIFVFQKHNRFRSLVACYIQYLPTQWEEFFSTCKLMAAMSRASASWMCWSTIDATTLSQQINIGHFLQRMSSYLLIGRSVNKANIGRYRCLANKSVHPYKHVILFFYFSGLFQRERREKGHVSKLCRISKSSQVTRCSTVSLDRWLKAANTNCAAVKYKDFFNTLRNSNLYFIGHIV